MKTEPEEEDDQRMLSGGFGQHVEREEVEEPSQDPKQYTKRVAEE